jgi:hypothetical protein
MAACAITLGEANTNQLDLTDAASIKLFKNGMRPLEGDKYNARPHGLHVFLKEFEVRASMFNWWEVLNVPDFPKFQSIEISYSIMVPSHWKNVKHTLKPI